MVIRMDRDGRLRNSFPCNHCLDNLKLFGFRNIYYSTDNGIIVKHRVDKLEPSHSSSRQRQYYNLLNGHS